MAKLTMKLIERERESERQREREREKERRRRTAKILNSVCQSEKNLQCVFFNNFSKFSKTISINRYLIDVRCIFE